LTISTAQALAMIGIGSTVATAIFWSSFYIGKIMSRLDRIDDSIKDHEARLDRLALRP
jgi:hypothetical protein